MLVSANTENDILYIRLKGELDHSKARVLKERLYKYTDSTKIKKVVLEMQNMDFMDSTGVGLIMGLYKRLKSNNKLLYFHSPSSQIDKILKVSGLYSIIPVIKQEVK